MVELAPLGVAIAILFNLISESNGDSPRDAELLEFNAFDILYI
jgi:hypothetical protein